MIQDPRPGQEYWVVDPSFSPKWDAGIIIRGLYINIISGHDTIGVLDIVKTPIYNASRIKLLRAAKIGSSITMQRRDPIYWKDTIYWFDDLNEAWEFLKQRYLSGKIQGVQQIPEIEDLIRNMTALHLIATDCV